MTTYNTGNPIGSADPRDLYDNAENLDEAANSSADTFQDRLGKSRLTWAGIVKAGSGDPGEIVQIVSGAVQDVVAVAQSAADRAEAARDAAALSAGIFGSVGDGLAATADGEFFTVIGAGDIAVSIYKRISASNAELVGNIPSSALVHGITQYYDSSAFNIAGFIYANSGVFESSTGYQSTDYIPVEGSESYNVNVDNINNSANAWYDKDKNYISGFAVSASTIVQAPQSARFIRLSTRNFSLANALFRSVEPRINLTRLGQAIDNMDLSITSNLVQYDDTNVEDALDSILLKYGQEYFTTNGIIYESTGAFGTAAGYLATDYLPIYSNTEYSVNVNNQFNSANAWFDKDKNYISGFNIPVGSGPATQVSPPNASFLRMSTTNELFDGLGIKSNDILLSLTAVAQAVRSMGLSASDVSFQGSDVETALSELIQDSSARFTDIERQLDDPLHGVVVVTTEDERNSQTIIGEDNHAWPPGRRVYDEGLRSEVYADGVWWRMPDGSPADLAERTYVYPSFDQVRANLPTYATAHSIIAEPSLDNWQPTRLAGGAAHGDVSIDDSRGFEGVRVDLKIGGTGGVIYQKNSPLTIHRYLIFNLYSKERASIYNDIIRVALINSAGDTLFLKNITRAEFGPTPEVFKASEQLMHIELDTLNFVPLTDDTTFDNVTGMRIEATRAPSKVASFWFDRIETASFRPCVTFRFDDAHESVYRLGYPIFQEFGFKCLTAVITGGVGRESGCTKEQLLEMQTNGWDLVSHGVSIPSVSMDEATPDVALYELEESKRYLKEELNSPLITRSCYIANYNQHPKMVNSIAYKFYDCKIGGPHLNSSMPRRPVGYANIGGSWIRMGAANGDGSTAATLIGYAEEAIAKQGWQLIMMHSITTGPGPLSPVIEADLRAFCQWLYDNRADIDVVTFSEQVKRMEGV